MNNIKCKNCGLVDRSDDPNCRRCGVALFTTAQKASKSHTNNRVTIPIVPIALAAAAAFGLYTFFGSGSATPANTNAVIRSDSQPQPQPTLSLRAEHEQRTTGSFKNAIQTSPGLSESQKHMDETQKLMTSEPTKK